MSGKLTPSDVSALSYLTTVPWATPADIGHSISPAARGGIGLKEQGAGRMGGRWASRAIKRGLAESCTYLRAGFSAYRITEAGRRALQENTNGS